MKPFLALVAILALLAMHDLCVAQHDKQWQKYEKHVQESYGYDHDDYERKPAPYNPEPTRRDHPYQDRYQGYERRDYATRRDHPYEDRYQGYERRDYGPYHSDWKHHSKHSYEYDAVCVASQAATTSTANGVFRSGSTIGNLAQATASCPANKLQVGGSCSVTCRITDGTVYVTELGIGNSWYSDDTRNSTGTVLNGLVKSYPGYFQGVAGTEANDLLIDQQLTFINTAPFDTSNNGNGVLRLYATTENPGKASVRFYNAYQGLNTAPVAPGSALATITSKFRWYMQPVSTPRTPAFNLAVVGTNAVVYSLSWVGTGAAADAWNEFSLTASTDGWRIYCTGCPGSSGSPFTMAALLADATYGNILLTGAVAGVGFNLGSFQRNCYVGIDWLETNLLNGGKRIDFAVPTAATLPTITMGGATIGGSSGLTSTPSAGWTWGIGATPAQTTCFGPAVTTAGPANSECANTAAAVCCTPKPSRT